MRKLIVGCGYLGRRVARLWRDAGDDVVALTRSAEHARELTTEGIEPLLGDVTDPATLSALPAAEIVLYAVGFDRHSGKSQREVYVAGLENVLRQIAPRVGRFLYVSSTSVYGQTAGEEIDERSVCLPTQPNGEVCLEAEQVVWRYFPKSAEGAGLQAANVLRLSGIYGPGRLLSRVAALQAGEPLTGNPDAYLNLIHVDDAAASVLACETRGRAAETYLVSDDQPIRRREYFELLARLSGAPRPRFAPSSAEDTGTARLNKRCCNRKLHEELQVRLAYPTIESGLPHALSATGLELPPGAVAG
jgi:nucleoside-diphosphate-sugar epimerase